MVSAKPRFTHPRPFRSALPDISPLIFKFDLDVRVVGSLYGMRNLHPNLMLFIIGKIDLRMCTFCADDLTVHDKFNRRIQQNVLNIKIKLVAIRL